MIKVRACLRCKIFLPIHSENFLNTKKLREFEKSHEKHNLITIPRSELTKDFKIAKNPKDE